MSMSPFSHTFSEDFPPEHRFTWEVFGFYKEKINNSEAEERARSKHTLCTQYNEVNTGVYSHVQINHPHPLREGIEGEGDRT